MLYPDKQTLTLKKWNRYECYLHKFEVTKGWNKKCYATVPLNFIDDRFEFIETVRFEKFYEGDNNLIDYLETINLIHNCECTFNSYHGIDSLYDWGVHEIGWGKQAWVKHNEMKRVDYKKYFKSYEVAGFPGRGWVVESPYKDEINIPKYYKMVSASRPQRYQLINIHA